MFKGDDTIMWRDKWNTLPASSKALCVVCGVLTLLLFLSFCSG